MFIPCNSPPRGLEAKKKVGDFEIGIRIVKNPIGLGDNTPVEASDPIKKDTVFFL